MSRRAPRLQEVAAQAGVSFITAWRALNAPDMVSDKSRSKVHDAAAALGYVTNTVARSLVTASSGIVGVIVPTLEDSIFAATVQGISDTLTVAGLELLVGISNYDEAREGDLVRAFIGRQADGLILTGSHHSDPIRTLLQKAGVAVVEMWDLPENPIDMVAGFSNFRMACDATAWLIQRGYRRIAFVSPPGRSRAIEREKGYRAALGSQNLLVDDALSIRTEPDMQGGAEAFRILMNMESPPDAIFFNGDSLAVGAMIEGHAAGLSFPQDVALMGLHDTMIAAQMKPGLTTVKIPRYEIGQIAAEAVIARLASPEHRQSTDVGFSITERGTA